MAATTTKSMELFDALKELLTNDEKSEASKRTTPTNSSSVTRANQFLGLPLDLDSYTEVYPNIFIGNGTVAQDVKTLRDLKVSQVLNAAYGPKFAQVDSDPSVYESFGIGFYGVPALDTSRYDIKKYFEEAARFMKDGLESGGRVYVHCHQGRSRSATLVLAYLMLHCQFDLKRALATVREKRKVRPNDGFLKQLCELEIEMADRSE